MEALTGKAVCVTGDRTLGVDQQTFTRGFADHRIQVENVLRDHGFAADGTEVFMDGRTGARIKTRLFVGCVEYYRLVHMAQKKIHARSTGPRDPLTRQPRDGRRFGGGLRIGEMESSAICAHGCSRVLQERFCEHSDAFEVCICSKCGTIADESNVDVLYTYCRRCCTCDGIFKVKIPFTFLLLLNELMSVGISVTFDVVPSNPDTTLCTHQNSTTL